MQEARRVAEGGGAKNALRDAGYMKERKRIQAVNDEKTARLRGLRLAKEAADREAAEKMAADKPASPKKRKTATATPDPVEQSAEAPVLQAVETSAA
jgi:hypothetical protein